MTEQPVRNLIDAEFPGEWGKDSVGHGLHECRVLRATNLTSSGIDYSTAAKRFVPLEKINEKRLQRGDLILEAAGGGPGVPVGRVARFDPPDEDRAFLASNFFRTLRPARTTDAGFVYHLLQNLYQQPRIWQVQQQTTGIINLNVKEYFRLRVPVPPLEEQRRIAEAIDTIDETIQTTECVISKYKSLRAGLASDLLYGRLSNAMALNSESNQTRMLDFKSRNSGISNDSEWERRCLGDIATLKMGQSPAGNLVKPLGDGLPFLQGNAEFGVLSPIAIFQCDEAPRRSAPGDSLISVRAPVGAINRSDLEYGIGRGLAAVAFEAVDPGFGHHALAEHSRNLHRVAQGTTFSAIGRTELAELRFPVPPLKEQRRIAETLDTIDETIQENEKRREKLQQLRAGLAGDLLSGRVRTVAA